MTASKELTLPERARKALAIEHTEKELEELAGKSADVLEIKDAADYELVKRSALVLRDVRVGIQKIGKAARDDANLFGKAVIAEEARLVGIISPEENRLKALRQAEDNKVAEKLAEDRRVEEARVSELKNRIKAIKNQVDGLAVVPSSVIKERLETIENLLTTEDFFAEFSQEATEAREAAADTLETMLEERIQVEEQKAEQERVAKEQADRQAELDKQAEDQRQAGEADRKRRELEADQVRRKEEHIAQQEQEKRDAELAEERADAVAERKERERLEGEIQIRKEADEKAAADKAEAELIAAAMPDIEKVEEFAQELRGMLMPRVRDPRCAEIAAIALEQVEEVGNQLLIDAGKLKEVSK